MYQINWPLEYVLLCWCDIYAVTVAVMCILAKVMLVQVFIDHAGPEKGKYFVTDMQITLISVSVM